MQQQLELTLPPPRSPARAVGEEAAQACADKAERVADFDTEGAGRFILGWLARYGQMSGEQLVNAAQEHGHRPHDARAFGSVFSTLSRKNLIRCVGYCEREKGHGTAGGRLWGLVR
jgi:hypothetical protein